MKITELRIGNYVVDKWGKVAKIEHLADDEIKWSTTKYEWDDVSSFKDTKAIPLTTDWLLKLGFQEKQFGYVKHEIHILKPDNRIDCLYFQFDGFGIGMDVELIYVHQLQNLIFSLTGEELIIKS